MQEVIKWVVQNLGKICTYACAFIFAASIIVKITPSTKDNEFLKKIIGFLDHFSIAQTADNKKYIEDAKKNLEEK